MISFFTIPKPFRDEHTSRSQRNAISSWKHAFPAAEIIVLGDEEGIAEAAAEIGVSHVPSIERNELQTPLLNSAFATAERLASNRLLCYVNSDIILTPDFAEAIRRVDAPSFLMIGRRTNIDLTESLDFAGDWVSSVLRRAAEHGTLEAPWGSDFFAFMKDTGFATLPPFAVGRPNWDNWMIARARSLSIPVFDLTPASVVIHQNHGYAHVRQARGNMWEGVEGDRNRALAGSGRGYTVLDADYRVLPTGIAPVSAARKVGLQIWHSTVKRLPHPVASRLRRLSL